MNDHWLWLGPFGTAEDKWHGASWTFNGTNYRAARIARHLAGRDVPADHELDITCDEPRCVRPSHTKDGTKRSGLLPMPHVSPRDQHAFAALIAKETEQP